MSSFQLVLSLALMATSALPGIPGDADGDRDVDLDDFIIMKLNFGSIDASGADEGDFDGDGDVDLDLGFNPSADFHEWGFTILTDSVIWHVDGSPIHTWIAPAGVDIPDNYEMFFNA